MAPLVAKRCGRNPFSKTRLVFPNQFIFVKQRVRLGASTGQEIDIYASADNEFWVCESKYWQDKKVGTKEVKQLIQSGEKTV